MKEEELSSFAPSPPPPGLGRRVLTAARAAEGRRPRGAGGAWPAWAAAAAILLAALGAYGFSLRPPSLDVREAARDFDRASARIKELMAESAAPREAPQLMIEARLQGPFRLRTGEER